MERLIIVATNDPNRSKIYIHKFVFTQYKTVVFKTLREIVTLQIAAIDDLMVKGSQLFDEDSEEDILNLMAVYEEQLLMHVFASDLNHYKAIKMKLTGYATLGNFSKQIRDKAKELLTLLG